MNIDLVAGARPNFIKLAPVVDEILKKQGEGIDIHFRIIHTGQHYDYIMSQTFFDELNIPDPDIYLDADKGSQARQTGSIMIKYEAELEKFKPDLCMVFGDVNSTLACSLTAKKMGVPVAHVEAGIRSGDWSMPEEINRIVTDSICDWYFTTSKLAGENLEKSGASPKSIFFVGNTMIDTLTKNRDRFTKPKFFDELKLSKENYLVLTLHRPANVDEEKLLKETIQEIILNSRDKKIIFPAHPRTKKILQNLSFNMDRLFVIEPLGYLEFNYLVENSYGVITDSGGITEETTVMGIPCITLRDNTERPETVEIGTNELIGTNPQHIKPALNKLFDGTWKKGTIPELWDGKTSERIVQKLIELYV